MATITAGGDKQSRAVAKPQAEQAAPAVQVDAPSRREFLYYIWTASLVLLLGQVGAGIIWFSLPRFREGTFGGVFNFPVDKFPVVPGADPVTEPGGRFHVVHTENDGLLVLYQVCTHLGCLPKWESDRFACPCHGSQFALDGNYITGPAPRGLDLFPVVVTFEDGSTAATDAANTQEGSAYAIPLNGRRITRIEVDTGERLRRPNHA